MLLHFFLSFSFFLFCFVLDQDKLPISDSDFLGCLFFFFFTSCILFKLKATQEDVAFTYYHFSWMVTGSFGHSAYKERKISHFFSCRTTECDSAVVFPPHSSSSSGSYKPPSRIGSNQRWFCWRFSHFLARVDPLLAPSPSAVIGALHRAK